MKFCIRQTSIILLTVFLFVCGINSYAQSTFNANAAQTASADDAAPKLPSEADVARKASGEYAHLSFENKTLTREDLLKIIAVKEPFSLDFTGTILTDEVVKYVCKLPNIRELDLSDAKGVTDAGIEGIAAAVSLEGLFLVNLENVTSGAVVKLIPSLTNLNSVMLSKQLVTDETVAQLRQLPKLQNIGFLDNDTLTDQGLYQLNGMNFKSFGLSGMAKITDRGLQTFAKMSELEAFFLISCPNISDQGLVFLTDLANLKSITIGDCEKVQGRGFVTLKKHPKLEEIYLSQNTQLADDCLYYFSQVPSIKLISIDASELISDKGLLYLKPMTGLETLIISSCPKVTQAGIDDIKKTLSKCEIGFFTGDEEKEEESSENTSDSDNNSAAPAAPAPSGSDSGNK